MSLEEEFVYYPPKDAINAYQSTESIAREEAVREQLQQSLLLAQAEAASLKTECYELRDEIERIRERDEIERIREWHARR